MLENLIKLLTLFLILPNIVLGQSQDTENLLKQFATENSSVEWLRVKESQTFTHTEFVTQLKQVANFSEHDELKEIKKVSSKNGIEHVRLQQHYKDIPIEGAIYIVHQKNGMVVSSNGDLVSSLNLKVAPDLAEDEALILLLDQIGATKYAWEDERMEMALQRHKEEETATYYPKGSLKILAPPTNGFDKNTVNYRLVYVFDVETIEPHAAYSYYVDAHTGEILDQVSLIHQCGHVGTALTHYYGTQNIITEFNGIDYELNDCERNVETFSANGTLDYQIQPLKDINNNWTDTEDLSACSAHWAAKKSYDYFLSEHNRDGYNGNRAKVSIWVDHGSNMYYGEWASGYMRLGAGDGTNFGPLTTLDIVGHELTHGVIQHTANLRYEKEAGALNESFADIFGTLIEYYADFNNFDWLLGEDNALGNTVAIRSLSNPKDFGQPNTYEGEYWRSQDCYPDKFNDHCGVHINSGVQNYWFYLLSEGGSGTNDNNYAYNMSGIGINKAADIVYESLNYLSQFSKYIDAKNASVQAAKNLYGANSPEVQAVEAAWCAVGVGICGSSFNGSLAVTSPNGGETFHQGLTYPITWTSSGNIGNNVQLDLSINGGSTWLPIADNVSNNGTYLWTVPSYSTTLAMIRVTALSDNSILDLSDAYFSIEHCNVSANFSMDNDTICAGESVNFSNLTSGSQLNYEWYINGAYISSTSNPVYDPPVDGIYTVELHSKQGNLCADIIQKQLVVSPNGNASFTFVQNGLTVQLTAPNNVVNANYAWTFGDNSGTSSETNPVYTYTSGGSYQICLTVNGSCGNDNYCQSVTVVEPPCLESDSLALVALYNSTDGPNWINTWDLSQPVNTWFGVTLSGDGCSVVCLDLDGTDDCAYTCCGNNLIGIIPPEIGNLFSLQGLYLARNELSGNIPAELGHLINLTSLHFYNNNISGNIPVELGNLVNLTDFHLGYNELSGNIPIELGNLSNLSSLTLSSNDLSGVIPSELGNLSNLSELALSGNNLSGDIPFELGNLSNLNFLNIGSNQLSGSIPAELGSLSNLWNLTLSSNNLSGNIPSELGNLNNLTYLGLSGNDLSGGIPVELGNLSNLNFLYLHNSQLNGCYPQAWCNLTFSHFNFTNTYLPDNGSDQGFQDFCNGVTTCTYNCLESDSLALVALYNSANGPHWTVTWDLSQPVSTWYGVTLSGDGCSVIKLSRSGNDLIGSIPPELGNLSNLTELTLQNGQLSGNIPLELGNLSNLDLLALDWNKLNGPIPSELGNLSSLTSLALYRNELSGSIPPELGNLTNLTILDLSRNELSGSIPVALGNLGNLTRLHIGDNFLFGNIPVELGNLSNLTALTLYNNDFDGAIPSELGGLFNLTILDLHSNDLIGPIPSGLGNLSNLTSLYLYLNDLTGIIPPELGNLVNLQFLDLSYNKLSSVIPMELGNFPNLIILNLDNNELTGCYPEEWCNLNVNNFNCTGNLGLPDGGSDQGFQDFCNGIGPCAPTNVRPGDFNFDGYVNYQDVVPFGFYFGETGIERTDQSITWSPKDCEDWGGKQYNGADVKHIDGNGDGVIDYRDTLALHQNYGLTHPDSPYPPSNNLNVPNPVNLYLQPSAIPNNPNNPNMAFMDVMVENTLGDDVGLYNGYFTIEYNHPLIYDADLSIQSSWIGTSNDDFFYMVEKDAVNKQMHVGFTRLDHSNRIGNGQMGTVAVCIPVDSGWDTLNLNLQVSNVSMQNSENISLPINGQSSSLTLVGNQCLSDLTIDNNTLLAPVNQVANIINTSGNVSIGTGNNISLRAYEINLNEGFSIDANVNFSAEIDPCSLTALKPSGGNNSSNQKSALFTFEHVLKEPSEVSLQILDSEGNKQHEFDIGFRAAGKQSFNLNREVLPEGKFMIGLITKNDRQYLIF